MNDFTHTTFQPESRATTTTATQQEEIRETPRPEFLGDKTLEVYRIAVELFRQGPDWVTFFREVLGVDGVARRLFTDPDEFLTFEKSEQYAEIQQMLTSLRGRNSSSQDDQEPTRVITVRLPKSLHESLRAEAHDRKTSMNKLCISKLLQVIEEEHAAAVAASQQRQQQ